MLPLALSFLAGILTVQQLSVLPELEWLLLTVAGAAIMAWRRCWPAAAVLAGFAWAVACAGLRLNERLPDNLAGQDIIVQGYIADLPEIEVQHSRFNFRVTSSVPGTPRLLRLTWHHPGQTVKAGQNWRFTVRLKPPHGNLNPGGFDYERWLFLEGIGATGYIRHASLLPAETPPLFLSWRQTIADRIDGLPLDPDSLGMIKALTIGEGNSLTPRQWDVFRKTGTTHLMVISGSHVALIAGLVYLLVAKLWARMHFHSCSPPQAGALAAIAGALLYAALTGFAVPAQRAVLMLSVGMAAVIRQRHLRPFHTLAAALFCVLFIDPLIVLSAGFWLSFLAVALIIYALAGRLAKPGFTRASIKINWYTSLGLAPLLLYFFQQVSLIAPLANLIAVPVISFIIVPLSLLAAILLLIAPDAGELLFAGVDFCLQGLWRLLTGLADLPVSALTWMQPGNWVLAFALLGVILLLAPKGMPSRWLGMVLLLPLFSTQAPDIPRGAFKLALLDVGQGLSAVVQTASRVLVYDTGGKFSETSNAGLSIIIPFLRSQGIGKVDSLVISHGDNDHIGGSASLMAQYPTDRLLTSVPQLLTAYRALLCRAGQSWVWDEVKFSMLSPKPGVLHSENDNSCVLHITSPHGKALLTGDIEAEAESQLVEALGEGLQADILVAPHHGSNTSSTPAFFEKSGSCGDTDTGRLPEPVFPSSSGGVEALWIIK